MKKEKDDGLFDFMPESATAYLTRSERDESKVTASRKPSLLITSEEQFREFMFNPENRSKYSGARFSSVDLSMRCNDILFELKDKEPI